MDKRNNHGDGVIELEGHSFKRVKQGLDEEQVLSFVNDLISQRDQLLHRQAHLSSLIELAERTVAEADNIAQKIKQEATEKAKADVDEILTKASEDAKELIEQEKTRVLGIAAEEAEAIKAEAEEQANKILEEAEAIRTSTLEEIETTRANAQKEAEATKASAQEEAEVSRASAQEEAEAIKTNAQKEAKAIRAEAEEQATKTQEEAEALRTNAREQAESMYKERIRTATSEIRDFSQRLYGELLTGLEEYKQQIITTEEDFERTLSETEEQIGVLTSKKEEDDIPPPQEMDLDEGPKALHDISTTMIEQMQADEQADTSELEKNVLSIIDNLEANDENGLVTLEVLPPVDIHRIMGLISQLEELEEVRTTELIPVMPNPLITVFLKEPLRLVEVLKTFPEIQQVEKELVIEGEADPLDGTAEKKQNRIKITFSDDNN